MPYLLQASPLGGNSAEQWVNFSAPTVGASPFNVQDYGATGNGTTDDTAAIAAAISACSAAGGGIVRFPATANAYKISSTLVVPANVQLEGDGPTATTISMSIATTDIIQLTGTFSGVRNLKITASVTRTAGAGINLTASAYDYRLERVRFDSMYDGIHIGTGVTIPNTMYFRDLDIHNSSHYHIYLQSGQNLYCDNVVCWQDSPATNTAGFFWSSQNSVYMSQCTFYQCGSGVFVQPSGAITIAYGWFVNCSCDTCDNNGWFFDAQTNSGTIQQMELIDCWGSTSGLNGFLAQGGTIQDFLVHGFRCYNNGTNGIAFFAGSSNVDVQGCRVSGNSRTTANTNFGIYFAGGVTHFSAIGNRSGAFDGFTARQAWGILVDTGAGNQFNVIGNDVSGNNNAAGFSDASTGTAKNISQNIPYNPIGSVTIAAPTSGSASVANKFGVPVFVVLNSSGGSVTALAVAGVSLPGPPLTFVLQPGQTFTPTYTGTLSVTSLAA